MTRYELDEYTTAVRTVDRLRVRLRNQAQRQREREAVSRRAIDDLQATHDAAVQALIEERVEVARLRRTRQACREAEELRSAIERLESRSAGPIAEQLQQILDSIDARESLSWLEAVQEARALAKPGEEAP